MPESLLLQPDCPPASSTVKPPRVVLPEGATDCHFHIFGPYARFPLARERTYTPPEATLANYRAVAATLGLQRFVLVQPSVYADDNRCTLDALQALGTCVARAVIGVPSDPVSFARFSENHQRNGTLETLHDIGVRGVRYNGVTGNPMSPSHLMSVAQLIAPLGWHLQIYAAADELAQILPFLRHVPVDVVIDHFADVSPQEGIDGQQFTSLCRFLDSGRGWVKIVGYRCSAEVAPYRDMTRYVRRLMETHLDRMLWGTDWPHPIRYHDMPDDGDLVDALAGWLDNPAALRTVLVDNPARLYQFPETPLLRTSVADRRMPYRLRF